MKVLVVGCGGTGTNWCKAIKDSILGDDATISGVEVGMLIIDGSKSNVRDHTVLDNVEQWICPNTDGAGKDRALCVREYKEFLASKTADIPEADLYIVLYGMSGGSGSVFGPELTLELLDRGKAVVGISNVTTTSKADSTNSHNVIRGLASYARKTGKPVVNFILYGDNTDTVEIDARAKSAIEALVYASSDKLGALDTSDIRAFLDYTRHGVPATLTELVLSTEVEEMREDKGKYLTTLSVVPKLGDPEPEVDELTNLLAIGGETALYFGTRNDRIAGLLNTVAERRETHEKIAKSHGSVSTFDSDEEMEY